MTGYTKDSKIRHLKSVLERNRDNAAERCAYAPNGYDEGTYHTYELTILLLGELLSGNTYDPETESLPLEDDDRDSWFDTVEEARGEK